MWLRAQRCAAAFHFMQVLRLNSLQQISDELFFFRPGWIDGYHCVRIFGIAGKQVFRSRLAGENCMIRTSIVFTLECEIVTDSNAPLVRQESIQNCCFRGGYGAFHSWPGTKPRAANPCTHHPLQSLQRQNDYKIEDPVAQGITPIRSERKLSGQCL